MDAFCPFGGIESALSLVTTGRMLSRIAWSSFTLLGAECINCNECVNVCPVRDTPFVGNRKRTKLGAGTVVLVSVILFTAVVAVASFTGGFEWKQKTIVETTTETGVFNPDEIRGSDTFRDVSEITGIDKKLFMNEFDLPIKDSAHREGSEWETENVREFVKKQLEFE